MEAQDELRLELMHARTELAFLLSDQVPAAIATKARERHHLEARLGNFEAAIRAHTVFHLGDALEGGIYLANLEPLALEQHGAHSRSHSSEARSELVQTIASIAFPPSPQLGGRLVVQPGLGVPQVLARPS